MKSYKFDTNLSFCILNELKDTVWFLLLNFTLFFYDGLTSKKKRKFKVQIVETSVSSSYSI